MYRDPNDPGGPGGGRGRGPTPEEVDALATLCSFIGWAAEDRAMYGGRRASEALSALSIITGLSVQHIRRIADPSQEPRRR